MNMKLLNDLKDCMSKTKYQKCKETIELGKYDTILFSLKECGKLINRLLTKNIIQQKHIENLQSELFISNDQLQSERIIRGQMYQQNIEKEVSFQEEIKELEKELDNSRDEVKYQTCKKIKARKDHHRVNKMYKEYLQEQYELENRMEKIQKRLQNISKNKKFLKNFTKHNNLMHYFSDFYPKIETTCQLCCYEIKKNDEQKCQNKNCQVDLCKSCITKINNKCPYCQCNFEIVEEKEDDDEETQDYYDDSQEYESEFETEFDYLNDDNDMAGQPITSSLIFQSYEENVEEDLEDDDQMSISEEDDDEEDDNYERELVITDEGNIVPITPESQIIQSSEIAPPSLRLTRQNAYVNNSTSSSQDNILFTDLLNLLQNNSEEDNDEVDENNSYQEI